MSKQEIEDLRKYEEEKRLMNATAGKSVISSIQLSQVTPTAAKKHLMTPKISTSIKQKDLKKKYSKLSAFH